MRLNFPILGLFAASVLCGQVQEPLPEAAASIEDRWGVRVETVRLAAADFMVDFRYRVLDVAKSKLLFERQTTPYMIHEASGTKLELARTAKVGPLRHSYAAEADRIYWMFFANPGKQVKRGAKVTVTIGDFRVDNLIVE